MNRQEVSTDLQKKRKFLLWLPLIILPFTTVVFWVLGGGSSSGQGTVISQTAGLNLNVPDANIKENEATDKLSFYELAEKDSLKLGDTRPLEDIVADSSTFNMEANSGRYDSYSKIQNRTDAGKTGYNSSLYAGNEKSLDQQLMMKLNAINALVNQKENDTANKRINLLTNNASSDGDIGRLEQMVAYMSGRDTEQDPEMAQIENTLDKLLDVQHPDRVRQQLQKQSALQKRKVFPVTTKLENRDRSLMKEAGSSKSSHQFYGLETSLPDSGEEISIQVVVHDNQELVNGSFLKLRMTQPVFINGILIPAGNFIYGVVALNTERASVEISSIRFKNHLLPVKLEAYDADGLAGIFMPGLVSTEVSKQTADNSLQLLELTSMDPSLKAQAAAAGINAAKSLAGRKAKIVRARIKAGYQLYLKDKNTEQ